jgi:hypothetical protein
MLALRGLALLLVLACPPAGHAGVLEEVARNYALVIGVDRVSEREDDQIPRLKFAVADATAVRDVLLRTGRYEITFLPDELANRRNIIRSFDRISREARPHDSFFLFFAGHGVKSPVTPGQTHWVTYGTTIADLEVDGLRMTHMLDYVQGIPAMRKVIILDHCFSGDISRIASRLLEPVPGGLPDAITAGGVSAGIQARELIPETDIPKVLDSPGWEEGGAAIYGAAYGKAFETRARGHGLFTDVLLAIFTAGQSPDGRFPGVLDLNQLNGTLEEWRSNIPHADIPQKPLVWRGGTITNWNVLDMTGSPDLIDVNATRYRQHLDTLYEQGSIELGVKRHCEDAIDGWRDALNAQRSPTPVSIRIVGLLSRLTSDVRGGLPVAQRGQALKELVVSLGLPL